MVLELLEEGRSSIVHAEVLHVLIYVLERLPDVTISRRGYGW
jgi:hypothetical protein